jgi:hypothetical protein
MRQVISELLALELTDPETIARPPPGNRASVDGLSQSLGSAVERTVYESLSFYGQCGSAADQFLPEGKRSWKIKGKLCEFKGSVGSRSMSLESRWEYGGSHNGCRDLTVYRTGAASFGVFLREEEWG